MLAHLLIALGLVAEAWAVDEAEWLFNVSTLPPRKRVATVEEALKTYSRKHCGLLLGALLSGDEEIKMLLPQIQRQLHLLVREEDAEYLAKRFDDVEGAELRDWLLDLLGFCGRKGFEELKKIYKHAKTKRERIGALRAMGNLMVPEAVGFLEKVKKRAKGFAEREACDFAEARLRWQTRQLKDEPRPRSSHPLVNLKRGAEKIKEALRQGGTLVLASQDIPRAEELLKELGVRAPTGGSITSSQHTKFWLEDFHPLVAYPFDFFYEDIRRRCFTAYSWSGWDRRQVAPLRLEEKPERAVVVIQEKVLGKGRVIFNGLAVRDVRMGAKLGIPERDPWEENLEWFHGDKEISRFLYLWEAREDFVSDHTPWGKPLWGGAIRVAIVTPNYNARDVVEFAQRLEMEYEHLPYKWAGKKGFAHGTQVGRLTPPSWEIIERVVRSRRDVIVLAGRAMPGVSGTQSWSSLPLSYREALLRLMRERGIGIMISGENGPLEKIPEEANRTRFRTLAGEITRVEWGKGRLACMARLSREPERYKVPGAFGRTMFLNAYDYWAQEVVKQIAWAGRREPPIDVLSVSVAPERTIELQVRNVSHNAAEGKLSVALRNLFGRVAGKVNSEVELDPGESRKLRLVLSELYAGFFLAEVQIRDKEGRSLGWGAFELRVPGEVEIVDLLFDKAVYKPGDEMVIKPVLKGKLRDGARGEVEVVDLYGRECGRWEGQVSSKNPMLRVKVKRPLWRYVYVRVWLRGTKLLTHFQKPWIVDVPPPTKDFPYSAWSEMMKIPNQIPATKLAGIDWLNADPETCLRNGLSVWLVGFGHIGLGHHAPMMNYQRNPNPLGPTFHQWRVNFIPQRLPELMRAGIRAIIDGDEESLGGEYGFHPASLHEFRKEMKVLYGSLEHLNEVWQTPFKSWSEVMPMLRRDVAGRESLAPMVELRMFMDTAYLHHIEFDRFVAESMGYEDVKLGLSTSYGGFADGWDIWKASKMLTCMIRQGTRNREKFYSWKRPDMVLGRWSGGYYPDHIPTGHFMPWHQLFHGSTVYATWSAAVGSDLCIWRADGSPRDGVGIAARELREIWTGPATMIRHSRRVDPLIGIHYSRASQMASAVDWKGAAWASGSNLENCLEMLGHQFRWISYEELELGFCDSWKGQCLFLPLSICLSDGEVEALKRFVSRGGVLVVDCDAGSRDGHGGPAGEGRLAGVLGSRWLPGPSYKGKLKLRLSVQGLPGEIEFTQSYKRIGVLTTGKAHGAIVFGAKKFPAWIVNKYGKGKAITLNFLPWKTKFSQEIIRAVLREAGVEYLVSVREKREEMEGVERIHFEDGPVRYTGLIYFVRVRGGWGPLRVSDEEARTEHEVEVRFPLKSHLYDVRSKRYIGETDRVELRLLPGQAHLFAHLPYRVKALKVTVPADSSVRGAAQLQFRVVPAVSVGAPHTVRIQIFDPTGRERPEYSRVLYLAEGKGGLDVPLAPNDPPGQWRVVATEAVSGIKAEKRWEVTR